MHSSHSYCSLSLSSHQFAFISSDGAAVVHRRRANFLARNGINADLLLQRFVAPDFNACASNYQTVKAFS